MDIDYRCARPINILSLLRQMGYHPIADRRTGSESWVRQLSGSFYPRFHMYVGTDKKDIHLSLHLDQKKSTINVPGLKRHAGEYNSATVTAEGARIQRWLDYSQRR